VYSLVINYRVLCLYRQIFHTSTYIGNITTFLWETFMYRKYRTDFKVREIFADNKSNMRTDVGRP
jgi:hypothetical protein